MVSRGGSISGFSLQIDLNWSKKSRSYLISDDHERKAKGGSKEWKELPKLAVLCVDIELDLEAHDAFGVWNATEILNIARSREGRMGWGGDGGILGGGREIELSRTEFSGEIGWMGELDRGSIYS
jgi:hypothetical protein